MPIIHDSNGKPITEFPEVAGKRVMPITGAITITPSTDFEGGEITVGKIAVEISFVGDTKSINLQSDQTNIGYIYIGKSNVTKIGENAMLKLDPGRGVNIELDDTNNALYVVSDTDAQNLFKMAII